MILYCEYTSMMRHDNRCYWYCTSEGKAELYIQAVEHEEREVKQVLAVVIQHSYLHSFMDYFRYCLLLFFIQHIFTFIVQPDITLCPVFSPSPPSVPLTRN